MTNLQYSQLKSEIDSILARHTTEKVKIIGSKAKENEESLWFVITFLCDYRLCDKADEAFPYP